jgi:hypothetical protein
LYQEEDELSQSGSGEESLLAHSFSNSFSSLNASKHSISSGLTTSSKHSLNSLGSSFSSLSKKIMTAAVATLPNKKYCELKEDPPEDVFTIEEKDSQELGIKELSQTFASPEDANLVNTSAHSGMTESENTAAEHSFAADEDGIDLVEQQVIKKWTQQDSGTILIQTEGHQNPHIELDIAGRNGERASRKGRMQTSCHSEPAKLVSPRRSRRSGLRKTLSVTTPTRSSRSRITTVSAGLEFPTKPVPAPGNRTRRSPTQATKGRAVILSKRKNVRSTNSKLSRCKDKPSPGPDIIDPPCSMNSSSGGLQSSTKRLDLDEQNRIENGMTRHSRSPRRHRDPNVILARILAPASPRKTISSDNIDPLLSRGIESVDLGKLTPRFLSQRQRVQFDFNPSDLVVEVANNSPTKQKIKPRVAKKMMTTPLVKTSMKNPIPTSPGKRTNQVFYDPGLPHQQPYL